MARLDDLDPAIAPTLGGGDPAPIDSLDEVPASIDDDLARLVRAPAVRPPPGRGAEIGRYLVLDKVGEGGIGVVLSAYDPQLDRKVAIKLLRRDRRQAASTGGRERALTEARALARLVHPHIVAVHDAGLLDDEIYVVMELVDGTDLRGWLDAGSRVRDEILDVFVQAGEGLAAAHDAGLVHRDFKPDNVLVGKDGRVRVADFGLARVLDAGTPSGAPDDRDAASAGPVDLTVTGAFVGTPAYMAPEQIDAGRVDAAADVFAYCASLWEALFAARPFEAPTLGERRAAIAAGVEAPADDRGAPGWLLALLRRGLAERPDERPSSMRALLDELARHRRPPRRRAIALVAGSLVLAGGGVALAMTRGGGAPAPCGTSAAELAPVWSPARAQAIGRGFVAAGAPGQEAWTRVRHTVDAYAARWIDGHRSACRATRVAGTQSEQVLDQRMGCLARAAAKLDAVARFLEADATTAVAYADDTLATLPDVGQCADPDQLGALDALPADPVRNARARELMATVADLQVGVRGEDRVSLDAARTALEAARALAWTPLVVEAAWAYGTAAAYEDDPDAARDGFREAALGALSLGNDAFAAGTLSDLADVYADLGDDKTALTWLDVAEAIAQRRPLNAGTRLHLLGNRSDVLRHAGRVDDAVAAAEAELALAREMSEDGEYVGGALHNLAVTQLAAGHLQEALRTSDEAVAETERVLGPDHPKLASLLMNASMFDTRAGHVDAAIAKARRGIAILDRWYGHEHPKVDALLNNLAVALRMHGDTAEARSLFEEVQRRRAARLGERSLDNGEALCNLAIMDLEDGELAIATTRAAEGLAVMESVLGPDDPELANALVLNGGIARYRGDLDASVAYLERAVAVVERGRGVDSPDAVNPRVELAHTEAARGHHARAVEVLTPSLALTERSADVPPEAAAETRFAMATSMVHVGGDRARAIALARQARDGYVGLGDGYASKVDDIDAWLATVTPARRGGR